MSEKLSITLTDEDIALLGHMLSRIESAMEDISKCRSVAHILAEVSCNTASDDISLFEDSTYDIANIILDYSAQTANAIKDTHQSLKSILEGKRDYFLK